MEEDRLVIGSEIQSLQQLMQDVRKELYELRRTRGQMTVSMGQGPYPHPDDQESRGELLSSFGRRVKILSERVAKRDLTYHASRDIREPSAIADLMSPLASEDRVTILSCLDQQSRSFRELEGITGKRGGALKHHLGQLEDAGYIQQYKNRGRYSITLDGQLAYRLSVWFASCLVPDDR